MVHIESPSNPLMMVCDIPALAKVVKAHGALLTGSIDVYVCSTDGALAKVVRAHRARLTGSKRDLLKQ